MQTVTSDFVKGKKVLLRYDIDVALKKSSDEMEVAEEFKLKAGLETLTLCLENAQVVILMGHVGRPESKVVEELRVAPIVEWFRQNGLSSHLTSGKLKILENLRFDPREEAGDLEYAKELAQMGDVYVNEAFSSYRVAVSTTVLPTLLPHAAGLRFSLEVEKLTQVIHNPKKPYVAIMGGAKVKDKLQVIQMLSKKADAVLIGGKLVQEIKDQNIDFPANVLIGKLNSQGTDIALETTQSWKPLLMHAKMVVWNGPLGKYEDPKNNQTEAIAQIILTSEAENIIGGGDIISALDQYGLLDKFEFVSVGGGAMLEFLATGTLPTIEALS